MDLLNFSEGALIELSAPEAEQRGIARERHAVAMFVNFYLCDRCGRKWRDVWSATCDNDCPHCGARHMSPYRSVDLPEEDEIEECEVDFDCEAESDDGEPRPIGFVD
jgi:DNA-directed RNA polymerase subunit RPC12/RpoP